MRRHPSRSRAPADIDVVNDGSVDTCEMLDILPDRSMSWPRRGAEAPVNVA